MSIPDSVILLTLLAGLALAIGSFINVVIYRLPRIMREEWLTEYQQWSNNLPLQSTTTQAPLSLAFPRSFCPHCKASIPFYHNIPILSYLILRGRCAACKHTIPWEYPLIEAISCVLAILVYSLWGISLTTLFGLLFVWWIIPLIVIDLKHQILPDSLTVSLLWLGLLANTQQIFTPLTDAVYGAIAGYLSLWCFIQLYYLLTKKIGMGHGDFKLFAAMGAWFGWTSLPVMLFIASCCGLIYGIAFLRMTHQSKDTPIPFGPFLGIAGFIYLLKWAM